MDNPILTGKGLDGDGDGDELALDPNLIKQHRHGAKFNIVKALLGYMNCIMSGVVLVYELY